VATHISRHLFSAGHSITCVWSRGKERAEKLAAEVGSRGGSSPGMVPGDADFYLLAVPDSAIPLMAEEFRGTPGIWIHTAGAVPMNVLAGCFREYGVLYPLQTLSADRPVALADTPLLVEGSGRPVTDRIAEVARSISGSVIEMDSPHRLVVHLAAVFANNFTNHMCSVAEQIMKARGADPALLLPLLRETFGKIEEMGPARAQTGPAVRNDQQTMHVHLEWLKRYPEWEKLYTFISRDIERSRQST
jgi:predicted short-subunit dehydrogenase-like oxidoreductase (DUF2520 family)